MPLALRRVEAVLGVALAYVLRQHQAICDLADIRRVRFHDLRHTAATLLLEQGVDLVVIKDLLGHAQIGTTADIYAHVRIKLQKQAIESLNDALDDSLDPTTDQPADNDGDQHHHGEEDDPPILVPA